jgi:hypothetical protein
MTFVLWCSCAGHDNLPAIEFGINGFWCNCYEKNVYMKTRRFILYSLSIRCYLNIINCDHIVSELFVLSVRNLHVQGRAADVFQQIQMRNLKPVLCTWISIKLNVGIHRRKGERPCTLFIARSYHVWESIVTALNTELCTVTDWVWVGRKYIVELIQLVPQFPFVCVMELPKWSKSCSKKIQT